jgi:hypothetical protein
MPANVQSSGVPGWAIDSARAHIPVTAEGCAADESLLAPIVAMPKAHGP